MLILQIRSLPPGDALHNAPREESDRPVKKRPGGRRRQSSTNSSTVSMQSLSQGCIGQTLHHCSYVLVPIQDCTSTSAARS